jgi:hypothetical protein
MQKHSCEWYLICKVLKEQLKCTDEELDKLFEDGKISMSEVQEELQVEDGTIAVAEPVVILI